MLKCVTKRRRTEFGGTTQGKGVMAEDFNAQSEQLVVEIQIRDMDRAAAFYRGIGFDLVSADDDFTALAWVGRYLFLDFRHDLPPRPDIPQANLRIMVADVDHRWKLVTAQNADIIEPIADRDYGLRDFTFTDPDGFGLRFAAVIC